MSQDYERALARQLSDAGYHVIRAPASGSKTTRDLPDLAWSKADVTPHVGELKTTGQDIAYYEQAEVEALRRFGVAFSATPVLLARYKQDTTYYKIAPEDARQTDSGNYAVERDMIVTPVL